jgi:hypothetical protein
MKVLVMFAASALSAVLVLPTISQAQGRGVYVTAVSEQQVVSAHRAA